MAVLLEGVSVVMPREVVIRTKYEGGWEQFRQDFPQAAMSNDGELISLNFFPAPNAMELVGAYLDVLEKRGLEIAGADNKFVDVAVIDQLQGLPEGYTCDWLTIYTARLLTPEQQAAAKAAVFSNVPKPGEEKNNESSDSEEDKEKSDENANSEAISEKGIVPNDEENTSEEKITEEDKPVVEPPAGPKVKAARLKNGKAVGVETPQGWDYEKSLTKEFGTEKPEQPFVPSQNA